MKTRGKVIYDPPDECIYLPATDEHFCCQKCLTIDRDKENETR